ncbi:hypothetical protein BpHYR1_002503 [Brachionus plicatilis]|uniref:Uncharacterized protein n=1 Tax=Brachionus plicatilis TaxID=10195 RepID=A0A3M7S1C5_BRAPC|nr:hypothetical protein BpHYR1_002503 [Brachionus plicatilis]
MVLLTLELIIRNYYLHGFILSAQSFLKITIKCVLLNRRTSSQLIKKLSSSLHLHYILWKIADPNAFCEKLAFYEDLDNTIDKFLLSQHLILFENVRLFVKTKDLKHPNKANKLTDYKAKNSSEEFILTMII